MRSQTGVLDLPKRVSLSVQTAAAIRKAVSDDVWQGFLPNERRLCELLQVSRTTIRAALHRLAKEGLIEIHHGRRNRILISGLRVAIPRSRLVVLVSHQPMSHHSLTAYQVISDMRAHLAEHGFTTDILVCAGRSAATQRRKLEAFVQQNRVLCCVLLSLKKELQEWFAGHSIPALVLGSCHSAVRLPSIDVDYRSVCRHAVNVLRRKGHSRIAFIVPNSSVAGDIASEIGFREGFGLQTTDEAVEALIVRHNGLNANVRAKVGALFASARPPTALLVAKPHFMFSVVSYLMKHGIKVPATVSLVSRDHDHLFENEIAHYRFDGKTFAHRISRFMLQMLSQGYLPPVPNLLFPRYVPGPSVASPRV